MYNVAVNVPEAVLYDTHMDERQVSMFAKRSVAPVLCDLQSNGFYVTKMCAIWYWQAREKRSAESKRFQQFRIFFARQFHFSS